MWLYSLQCRINRESQNSKVIKTKSGRIIPLSKCAVSDSKKSKFINEQEASRLLSSLGLKTPLSKTFSRSSFILEILASGDKI